MSAGSPVLKIVEPVEILAKAAEMEQQSAAFYNDAAAQCGANADATSKQLFEALVRDEESHFDEFDRQMDHLKRFGPAYLALQSFGVGNTEGVLGAGN
jgi:bacterioferritin